ncbi:hypothetical protein [Paenibacillus lautus]|uniref:hypothetical protein n=1 Tax=Paenibacillus lautus TaxID=1401 RepID=UPI003D9A5392
MTIDEINQRIKNSVANQEYVKGKETRYYILTLKYNENHYGVKLLDHHEEVESADINGRLDAAKKLV